jgi:2-C-methyl-D-erythritol 4-phosphate cytidylyltransferase/2-C-methyl-D-erythritol 2,4-cyclodiphosphate synthase
MSLNGKTIALVVAAGAGSRAGTDLPKQYRRICSKPLLVHALDHLRHPLIDEVRVVIGCGQEELYRSALGEQFIPASVAGGETRQESVRNGLEAISSAGGAAAVLIHDAARPFLPAAIVDRLLKALEDKDGAVPVLPVVDSLAHAGPGLGDPVDRSDLVRVQTPQAFRFGAILEAHRSWTGRAAATDDAQVARAAGLSVATVEGNQMLEKLTFAEDFERAEQRLSGGLVSRTAMGFDVHAFAAGETLWLGGILIPHSKGLSGHSDADVALHALTDALLGTIGAGDIGQHFPPSDPQWRGTASSRFLDHARTLIEERGGRIDHVDLTIICEAPKIGPHREAIRERIAALLRLPPDRVSVKATTTERLGFAGRGEGIAAQAVATVRLPEQS